LIIAGLALALSACAAGTPPPATPAAPAPTASAPTTIATVVARADSVILTGERAFAVAELGYITAAEGARLAIRNGFIKGDAAAWVRDRNAEVRVWLVRGKATADAAEKARLAAQIFNVTDRLSALTGRK
jgi:hypothetical protein